MEYTQNDRIFKEGLDAIIGLNGRVNASRANYLFQKLYKEGYEPKLDSDFPMSRFKELAEVLDRFPNESHPVEYDFNDLESTFNAASHGDPDAAYDMFFNCILHDNRKYSEFEDMITNVNIANFYLIKAMEYGNLHAKVRLAISYVLGDAGFTNPKLALKLVDELRSIGYESDPDDALTLDEIEHDARILMN